MNHIIEVVSESKHTVIPPLRERVEQALTSGDMTEQYRDLLRDALNESETNFTMYQAWVKRATEAETQTAELQKRLVEAEARLQERAESDVRILCLNGLVSINNGEPGIPCPHCATAVERHIQEYSAVITTTGAEPKESK